MKLWPHQQEAVDAVIKALGEYSRVQIHMACGTGKTITAAEIVKYFEDKIVIWLSPTIELMIQTSDVLANMLPTHEQTLIAHRRTKNHSGSTISGNSDDIIYRALKQSNIILCTYNSFIKIANIIKDNKIVIGLMVADEAHKTAGSVNKLFGKWLDNSLPIEKRLSMTATPRSFLMGKRRSIDVADMRNENIFGKVAYRYSFYNGINDNILCGLEAIIPIFTPKNGINPAVSALIRAKKTYRLRKILVFHNTVREAENFSSALAAEGIETLVVTGRSPPKDLQYARLRLMENDIDLVVSNVKLYSEGIDIPSIDAVFFTSYKNSHVILAQQIGRVARKTKSKNTGYVILPPVSNEKIIDVPKSDRLSKIWVTISNLMDITASSERISSYPPALNINFDGTGGEIQEILNYELSSLVFLRSINLKNDDWSVIALAVIKHLKAGGLPFSKNAPHRMWLSKNRKKFLNNNLDEGQTLLFQEIENKLVSGKILELTEAERYISRFSKGGPPEPGWSIKIRDRRRLPGYGLLYDKMMEVRRQQQSERQVRVKNFLDAYQNGRVIDRSLYAQFISGFADVELNKIFQKIHKERLLKISNNVAEKKHLVRMLHQEGKKLSEIARIAKTDPKTVKKYISE